MTCVALFRGGPYFDLRTKDCQLFWHLAPKEATCKWDDGRFFIYRIPAHDFSKSADPDSDGASLFLLAKVLRPSLRERMFGASLFHDSGYHGTLEVYRDGQWVLANLTKDETDELLKALMYIEAVTEEERVIVFEALEWFGKKAWDEDHKKTAPGT
jgi:hypothetical protein